MSFRKDLLFTFLFIAVAPFCVFVHFAPLGDFWDFFIACSAVTICFVLIFGWHSCKDKAVVVSPLIGYLLSFFVILCLLATLQPTALADKASLAVYGLIVLLTALLAVQLAQHNNTQYYDYLAFILFVGGVIESVGAIAIQYRLMGIDYWMVPIGDRLIGFIAQSNQLAIYIMVSFLALCYLSLRGIFHIVLLIIFSLLFGFVLLGSGSRAVLIYLLATALISLFCWIKGKDKSYLKLIAGLVALIIGAIIYKYLPDIVHWFSADTSVSVNSIGALSRSAASDSFRLSEISKAFVMLKSSPLVGVGLGNYAVQGFWLGVNDPSYTVLGDLTLHSHNLFAQIMAEFGLIGLVGLLVLLAYIGLCFWKTPKSLQWWLVASVFAVYFINSMLEYVMWRMHFVPLLMLVLVPLLSSAVKIRCPRIISGAITIMIAGLFVVTANSSLDAYAKSFFYSGDIVAMDKGDYQKFKSAAHNLLWGRDIQMQEFANLSPAIYDFAYQQKVTDEALAWRPYAPVIANKIQLSLMSGQIGDLDKLSHALVRAYPNMVPAVCNYFKEFSNVPSPQGLRIVKKALGCRVLTTLVQ